MIDRAPAHGSIASIATGVDDVATIEYVESPGTATHDSFTFHADDGFRASAVGTDAFDLMPSLAAQTPVATTTGSHRTRVSVSFGKASIVRLMRHSRDGRIPLCPAHLQRDGGAAARPQAARARAVRRGEGAVPCTSCCTCRTRSG